MSERIATSNDSTMELMWTGTSRCIAHVLTVGKHSHGCPLGDGKHPCLKNILIFGGISAGGIVSDPVRNFSNFFDEIK